MIDSIQLFPGAVEGADHFSSIINDVLDINVPLEMCVCGGGGWTWVIAEKNKIEIDCI